MTPNPMSRWWHFDDSDDSFESEEDFKDAEDMEHWNILNIHLFKDYIDGGFHL